MNRFVSMPCPDRLVGVQQRRLWLRTAVAGATALAAPWVRAQGTGPMRWLVGYPAGGGADFVTRAVARAMEPAVGGAIEVVNVPGQGGSVAAAQAAKAPADGRHLFTADNGILVYNKELFKSLPYNPERDFASVGFMARTALFIVASPKSPFKSIQDVLKLSKDEQAKLEYASPGAGSPHHLAMELFKRETGLQATHKPYRGTGLAMPDVIAGKVPLLVVDAAGGMKAMREGQVLPLLSLASFPVPQLREVPRPSAIGLWKMNAFASVGLVVPKATAPELRERLGKTLLAALNQHDLKSRLLDGGWESVAGDALFMDAYMAAEHLVWPPLIRQLGLKLDS